MFGGRDISTIKTEEKKISSLTRQLRDISYQPQNPFREYVKFDGNVRIIYIYYNYNYTEKFSKYLLILGSSRYTGEEIWNFFNNVETGAQ